MSSFVNRVRLSFVLAVIAAAPYAAAAGPALARPTADRGPDCILSAVTGAGARSLADREPITGSFPREVPATFRVSTAAAATFSATIPVYVHVITDGKAGAVTDLRIARQITALGKTYHGDFGGVDTGFRFQLAAVDRTVNKSWFRAGPGTAAEKQMKRALHAGGANALNVYTTTGAGFLGWATFPSDYAGAPLFDGVVVDFRTLPGGPYGSSYSLGYTLTHESGHWLGLYHTFEGGCGSVGDRVSDTPPEKTPTDGCPIGKNTCPAPGSDPIHNYMDYSYDACYTEFTPGQATRMAQQWLYYRAD